MGDTTLPEVILQSPQLRKFKNQLYSGKVDKRGTEKITEGSYKRLSNNIKKIPFQLLKVKVDQAP